MDKNSLKVALLAKGFKRATGPGTYYRALKRTVAEGHLLCSLDGSCGHGLDLVHVVDAKRVSPHALASVQAPVIADFHDHYWTRFQGFACPDYPLRWLRQKQLKSHHVEVIKKAAAVVVHSRAVARSIQQVIDALPAEDLAHKPGLFLVPYGIAPEELSTGHAATREPAPEPIILMVGSDFFRKGVAVLLKALPMVLKRAGPARAVVIGDDHLFSRAAAGVLARGLPVTFLPAVDREELNSWYERASLLVLPSFEEGFGIVLVEAMAKGLPVVGSELGGIPEAIEHRVSGLLHRPGDPADLAENICALLQDKEQREKLVQGGKEKAAAFSLQSMAVALEGAYRYVVEGA